MDTLEEERKINIKYLEDLLLQPGKIIFVIPLILN